MSLFSNADTVRIPVNKVVSCTAASDLKGSVDPVVLHSFSEIKKHLGKMGPGANKVFFSDGSWSNYELMAYLLEITGPALVAFSTWSISEKALSMMSDWQKSGRIIDMYAVLDVGIRNRKPHIYQQAQQVINKLKLSHCHAKLMAIVAPGISFLVVGSANFTRNPRKEAGVVICDRSAAEFSFNWIKNVYDGGSL